MPVKEVKFTTVNLERDVYRQLSKLSREHGVPRGRVVKAMVRAWSELDDDARAKLLFSSGDK